MSEGIKEKDNEIQKIGNKTKQKKTLHENPINNLN